MHDTAFELGTLAMNIYAELSKASILDVGAKSINGSLRERAMPTTRYVGLDIEEGDGVDLIAEPGKPFPVEDESFDLVMATSVFEHDDAFWLTFLEMCRAAKTGGYVYINAPSNGAVHRYPRDSWRFYADAGCALANWATSQGLHINLVESFIAERDGDIWNDFVSVFRKGRLIKPMPTTLIYQQVRCSNVITWRSSEILLPRAESEDMVLIRDLRQKVAEYETELRAGASIEGELAQAREEFQRVQQVLDDEQSERAALQQSLTAAELRGTESAKLREEALQEARNWQEAYVRQCQTTADLQGMLDQVGREHLSLQGSLADQAADLLQARNMAELAENDAAEAKRQLEAERKNLLGEIDAAKCVNSELASEILAGQAAIQSRSMEIEDLMIRLREANFRAETERGNALWFSAVAKSLLDTPRWWALLRKRDRRRREEEWFKTQGLFDPQAYLAANPDVGAAGMNPVRHYIQFGLLEERLRGN